MSILKTFTGGVHMPEYKELSEKQAIEEQKEPNKVVIPLNQHVGAECTPLVKKGDFVREGQKIGDSDASLFAPVHASISGIVRDIGKVYTTGGWLVNSITIEKASDEELEALANPNSSELLMEGYGDFRNLSKEKIIELIKEAGIIGMGGGAFPSFAKLQSSDDGTIDTIIINAAECEPFLTCDHRMMLEYSDRMIGGLRIVMKYLNVSSAYIGIEDNKQDAIDLLEEKLKDDKFIKVAVLKTKFPQGDAYRMVDSILGRKVPQGGRTKNVNTFVSNVGTFVAIYDAVTFGHVSHKRVVTVTGNGVKTPKNINAYVGTSIRDLVEQAGGFNGDVTKVIVGGPMTGVAQYSLDTPISKNTSGIILLTDNDYKDEEESQCIKCGKCVEACPVHLMPLYISRYQELGNLKMCDKYNAQSCIVCGSCSYVCPAKRFLAERISVAKREIKQSLRRSR